MFFISIQINRQSSIGAFYFLYLIFILHICTAFLTIIHGFKHDLDNDREEIIQLSIDSIHVVKSTESQILNIEENANTNEEKELLLTLMKIYEDEESSLNKSIVNETSIINSSLSLRLTPPSIHFREQSIAIPRMQRFMIINEDTEPLELYSITGTNNEFYAAGFKDNIVPPDGGEIIVNIYYLPRTVGLTKSAFTIQTNRGSFTYNVSGIGKSNPYRLRPLTNIKIPLNSTYEYIIKLFNPFNYSININEIYTSDENLIIELLTTKNPKNRLKNLLLSHEQWHLKPYETKSIIKMNYFAYKLNQLHAFICIKTNFSENIILPIEINVSNHTGLYSNVDLLEFTSARSVRSITKTIKVPIYVLNYGLDPVVITDVRVTSEHQNYITVRSKTLQIPPDIHRLNQIADVIIHPNLIPSNVERIRGYIEVYTLANNEKPVLKIPFDERVLHGSLDFMREETYFYISNTTQTKSSCQPIRVLSQYKTPIAVYNLTINKLELILKYIQIEFPSSFFYVYPDQWTEILCITPLPQSSSSVLSENIQTVIDIHTNLSYFNLPFYLYNGYLNLNLVNDKANGGIKRGGNDPNELLITSIPVNTTRTVTFILTNTNPIDIEIKKFHCSCINMDIQLDYIESLNENDTKIKLEKKDLSQIVVPKQHQAVFSITISGTVPTNFYNESIRFTTDYQNLDLSIKYEIINGSIEFVNKTPLHIDVFPNHVGSAEVYLLNKFDEPVNITRIQFVTYGLCFSFTWSNASNDRVLLQSNKVQRIGRLHFDMAPLCKSFHTSSESTCYCGLNYHPEFKQQWEDYIYLLNNYELDHILVKKFRNLWKEWTSLLRKQRIQTNIWLYTNRANISWPVTIGFTWPSVLEQMSSQSHTPIVLDFQVTFINITKTRNITITNPSSDRLVYAVELLNTDMDTSKTSNQDQIFIISATSKRADVKQHVHHFNLLPNEKMTFTISYRPTSAIKHDMYFLVRNNLTVLESIHLRGEGGIGSLHVGNRLIGSSILPIIIEMYENQYKFCPKSDGNSVLRKTLTLQNSGNMQTVIHQISFGHSKCFGQGFFVAACTNIEIEPNDKYELKILYQPDYTSTEITDTLILDTNIGLLTFPIIVRIPQNVLLACYKTISHPPWELRPYCLSLCMLIVSIVLILTFGVFYARKSFENYLTRAEWRDRIQTTNNKIFDLRDLSSAIQDEQKPRSEQIETEQIIDTKKDRPRRSIPGNTARSSTGSSKEFQQKVKQRAMTDGGPLKPPKPRVEVPTKPKPSLQRHQSDQNTTSNIPKPVSSSTVSEEESEPFITARPNRVRSKRKGSLTVTTPPKAPLENLPRLTQKSSLPIDQKDFINLDDSLNDQQWQKVISHKGQRKTSAAKRETTEESQQSVKPTKVPSTDTENSTILTSSSRTQSSVSHQSRELPGHRSIPNPSDLSTTKRKSLLTNTSISSNNRERAFRQLTEQLWAAGLPSSTTACSMSIRSRSSSAPPSEHGGNDRNDAENIDWDEPDTPDEDFGRYTSQTEYSIDESERLETQNKPPINHIPPLMSLTITPPPPPQTQPLITTNTQQKIPISPTVVKENIEPLPFPQHGPGPIQRPNKLSCLSNTQLTSFIQDSTQSPDTPDVLVQINHLVDDANNTTNLNDISTPNVPWTPFSPPVWSTKYDSTWPLGTMQSPNISITTQMQNPFAQRQTLKEETSLWPTSLEPSTPNNTWLKFLPVSDSPSSSSSSTTTTRQENDPNNPFWNPINLNESQQNSSASWWSKSSSSDENNNNDKDHSRWDFAR